MQTPDFQKFKKLGRKISMITCYDFWSAQLLNQSKVDCLLVGDSLAMVMHGHPTTLPASIEVMALHTAAVTRGAPDKFVVGDLPFLSYRKSLSENMNSVELLMKAGAQAVKLEGAAGNLELIRHIVESGVPVMGHLGLTPQSIHQLGGFRVQGKDRDSATLLNEQALALQEAGCFSVVLECVPSGLAERVSQSLIIPTIGIGAGPHTDGQVLVLHDMLGLNQNFEPKFLRRFQNFSQPIIDAINRYDLEVKECTFPSIEESYE
ncbi:MAG: 3-methyl-2-oxobutanoate hydroxymethyltransferase [Bdellovibrionales bacterium]|nr:3-methyl-2-oxobutanoate hydroxymethyltransferase [Bdellovibrionales bacterium]